MDYPFWISVWARLRRDEVICIPKDFEIHSDFTVYAEKSEIQLAFRQIHSFYTALFSEISENPKDFGMPLYSKAEYRVFSQPWRDAGQASYRPLILLYNLLISGTWDANAVLVSIQDFKMRDPVKQSHMLFKKLSDYGFVFDGLSHYKTSDKDIVIRYPDHPAFLWLLKMLADKASHVDPPEGFLNCTNSFLICHYRLLQDDMNTVQWSVLDALADRMHTRKEKEFVYKMDQALMAKGLFRKPYGGFECYGLAYYFKEKTMHAKGPYSFRLVSRTSDIETNIDEPEKMRCMLRIRNPSRCMEYLQTCPDTVKEIFRHSDPGCQNRPCSKGVAYEFEGTSYWRCGCCAPAFIFKPNIDDIPHYIRLVELGEKK